MPKKKENSISQKKIVLVKKEKLIKENNNLYEINQQINEIAKFSNKMVGVHVSAAGGAHNAINRAIEMGCRSFAIFIRNQRRWDSKPMKQTDIDNWNLTLKNTNFLVNQIVVHGSYLLNACSSQFEKTRNGMLDECKRCELLGIMFYVFHPGSLEKNMKLDEGLKNIAETINFVHENTTFVTILIETMTCAGNQVGGKFTEIRQIIDQISNQKRVGVCIDTCHIFVAGYELRTKEAYEETMNLFDKQIGFNYLKAVHLNDSKGDFKSRLDRHEKIGKGKLGLEVFSFFMKDDRLNHVPLILETPEGGYSEEILQLYKLENNKFDVI